MREVGRRPELDPSGRGLTTRTRANARTRRPRDDLPRADAPAALQMVTVVAVDR